MKNLTIAIAAMFWVLGGFPVLAAQAADYKLAMSAEKDVCQLMLKYANEGLLQVKSLENLSGLERLEASFVKWEEVKRAPSFQEHNGNVEGAVFDINNDGQLDWIVRIQWAIGGLYSHELLTYEKRSEPGFQEDGFALQDENRADVRLSLRGQSYLLTKIPKHKTKKGDRYPYYIVSPPYLLPFQFNHATYILAANPFVSLEMLPGHKRFAAVLKYSASFQLRDVCYLEEVQ